MASHSRTICSNGRACPRGASCARALRGSVLHKRTGVPFYRTYGDKCPLYVEAGEEEERE